MGWLLAIGMWGSPGNSQTRAMPSDRAAPSRWHTRAPCVLAAAVGGPDIVGVQPEPAAHRPLPQQGEVGHDSEHMAEPEKSGRLPDGGGRRSDVELIPAMHGLELARRDPPDMVLLDLQLPDRPGTDVLAALRSDPATSNIPVVVLSADATLGRSSGSWDRGPTST